MIEFDPDKDSANIAKHGVSLRLANRIDLDDAILIEDLRRDYGEPRWLAYQEIDGRLYVLVFTERKGRTRAISLRKGNEREQTFFESQRGRGSPS